MLSPDLFRVVTNLAVIAASTTPQVAPPSPTTQATTLLINSIDSVRLLSFQTPKPGGPVLPPAAAEPLFTDKERIALLKFWSKPGRYVISAPPEAAKAGPWQVRLTPEGSTWFLIYQRTVAGALKLPPTQDARPTSGPYTDWEKWVEARLAWDRYQAQQAADSANASLRLGLMGPALRTTAEFINEFAPPKNTPKEPEPPGPIPQGLLVACGNPPSFAGIVTPLQYQVKFDDPDETYSYIDNVKLRERYAYYRFPKGVVSYGTRVEQMTDKERESLFRDAGFPTSEQRIFCAVSAHEGGFETVQTYDTGYVSIGFIQFVTLEDGRNDLSNVLLQMKTDRPKDFAQDFHRYGIDVRPDLTMVVIDPVSGAELSGKDAVMKVIDDKRLTAVFQRAGRRSGFRIAQIKVAKSYYWPVNDPLEIPMPDGTTLVGRVGDVITSEAGLATLLDRKINTGNIRLFPDVVARIMNAHGCKSLADAAQHEREIVAALKYREDFLANPSLGQPKIPGGKSAVPTPTPTPPPTKTTPTSSTDETTSIRQPVSLALATLATLQKTATTPPASNVSVRTLPSPTPSAEPVINFLPMTMLPLNPTPTPSPAASAEPFIPMVGRNLQN